MTPEQLADYLDMKHIGQHKAAAELRRLAAENAELKSEMLEQCRIIGISGSREARLDAENKALKAANSELGKELAAMKAAQPAEQHCKRCGDLTMHRGDVCYGCNNPAQPAQITPAELADRIDAGEQWAVQPAKSVAVHQFRTGKCADWYDGYAHHEDGGGPYEERTLYTAPAPAQQPPKKEQTP